MRPKKAARTSANTGETIHGLRGDMSRIYRPVTKLAPYLAAGITAQLGRCSGSDVTIVDAVARFGSTCDDGANSLGWQAGIGAQWRSLVGPAPWVELQYQANRRLFDTLAVLVGVSL